MKTLSQDFENFGSRRWVGGHVPESRPRLLARSRATSPRLSGLHLCSAALTAAVLLLALSWSPAMAGRAPEPGEPRSPGLNARHAEPRPVAAVRALLNRCLPRVAGDVALPRAGLRPLGAEAARQLLGARAGTVWTHSSGVLVTDFNDAPACRVIALGIEPAVTTDLVIRVFGAVETPFVQKRFRVDTNGGFAAVYTAPSPHGEVVLRLSTHQAETGSYFAVFAVERGVEARPVAAIAVPPHPGSAAQ